jgi:FAD dependent oxidoreductase TIGR03364
MSNKHYDLVVVGAGIVGLAHALMGQRRGWSVAVIERDHRCVGASIRNFGFVTVTGQRHGSTWQRALRSRDIWADLAPKAGIAVLHRGLWVVAQRPSALAVLDAFCQTPMGQQCQLYVGPHWGAQVAGLKSEGTAGALFSPHELRVESREALPQLARWLAYQGVDFLWGEEVLDVLPHGVRTPTREVHGERVVVCPGAELNGVARQLLPDLRLGMTRLQMLRVRPEAGYRLPAAVMSDLSLVRYPGYAILPQSRALRHELEAEVPDSLADGIHLIAVQSGDGTLVVGDSHHEAMTPHPFGSQVVDRRILGHLREVLDLTECEVVERWNGVYPVDPAGDCLIEAPEDRLRVVVVTSGTGASTAFAIAEEVIESW